ncbi:MAG: hypothetical protein K6F87_06035 [Lachnospiraceae bacterium]|nr:hypothetical protein [Lachnospiraceae bacterium]
MTRNFENEYRQYADSNVPDLWGRIEAAIDESSKKEEERKTDKNRSHKSDNKVIAFVSKYSAYIAACACILLTIGAISLINRTKSGTANESAAMADYAPAAAEEAAEPAASSAAEASVENAAPAAEETYSDEAPYDAFMAENKADAEAPAPEMSEAESVSEANEAAETYNDHAITEGATNSYRAEKSNGRTLTGNAEANIMAESEEAAAEAADEETKDGDYYDYVIICTVTDIEGTIVSGSKEDKSHAITVRVKDALSAPFEDNEEVVLTAGDEAYDSLKKLISADKNGRYRLFVRSEVIGEYELITAEPEKK